MSQPTFVPVPVAGQVRTVMPTPAPEVGRVAKTGLLRPTKLDAGPGQGSPAPDAGYALTLAHREVGRLDFAREGDRHDVELGVALVAAKRASLVGRGPTLRDVRVALAHFGLDGAGVIDATRAAPFAGLAHSYAAQRALVDGVEPSALVTGASA